MARLVLVGLPGVGKTTVARLVAAWWSCDVRDTDDVIATAVDCSCAQYLRSRGQEAFRHAELAALQSVLTSDAVVATGGGIVTIDAARDLLRGEMTLWLDCSDEVLLHRLAPGDRPLIGPDAAQSLQLLRHERDAWYRDVARARIDASGSVDEVAQRVRDTASEITR